MYLRRCTKGLTLAITLNLLGGDDEVSTSMVKVSDSEIPDADTVGQCMLPASKPELKARLVSALGTKM